MKIVELLSGITLPVTNEEADVLKKLNKAGSLLKRELEPREQVLMSVLVNKDVVVRKQNADGKLFYTKKIRD